MSLKEDKNYDCKVTFNDFKFHCHWFQMEAKKNDKLREIFFIQTNTNKKPFLALTGKLQMEGQV